MVFMYLQRLTFDTIGIKLDNRIK